jgi:hypothetical protein
MSNAQSLQPISVVKHAPIPFWDFDPKVFEMFCLDLLKAERGNISSGLYGKLGQKQCGIDGFF